MRKVLRNESKDRLNTYSDPGQACLVVGDNKTDGESGDGTRYCFQVLPVIAVFANSLPPVNLHLNWARMFTRACVLTSPLVIRTTGSALSPGLLGLRRIRFIPRVQPPASTNYWLRRLSSTKTAADPASPHLAPLVTGTWVDRMPAKARPYVLLARVDKPIGTMLLLWPCST